jgi:hypothetical protein
MVMLQQSSESFTTLNRCVSARVGLCVGRERNDVAESLVWPFNVIMLDVLSDGVPKHRLAKEDQSFGAFILDGTDEAFCEGVQVGRVR